MNLLKDKSKELGVCTFFTFLIAMCAVGAYYLQFSHDIYWIKLATYAIFMVWSVYISVYSAKNNEKEAKTLGIGLSVVFLFCLIQSLFGIISRADLRLAADNALIAVKAFFVFSLLDMLLFKKSFLKKWWYILCGVVLLLIPTLFRTLPLLFTAFSTGFFANGMNLMNKVQLIACFIFGLAGVAQSIYAMALKKYTFAAWSSLLYGLSVVLVSIFGMMGMGLLGISINASQWILNTALLFELSCVLIILAAVNVHPLAVKKTKK